jgi:hypothetical protein
MAQGPENSELDYIRENSDAQAVDFQPSEEQAEQAAPAAQAVPVTEGEALPE